MPWGLCADFVQVARKAGGILPDALQKLPGNFRRQPSQRTRPRVVAGSFVHHGHSLHLVGLGRDLINTGQINHLPARTLDANPGNVIVFALNRHARFAAAAGRGLRVGRCARHDRRTQWLRRRRSGNNCGAKFPRVAGGRSRGERHERLVVNRGHGVDGVDGVVSTADNCATEALSFSMTVTRRLASAVGGIAGMGAVSA